MIVDDDPQILSAIRDDLKHFGFDAIGFNDPLQALEHLRNNPKICKLVIADA